MTDTNTRNRAIIMERLPATTTSLARELNMRENDCRELLLKMRDEAKVKFNVKSGRWSIT